MITYVGHAYLQEGLALGALKYVVQLARNSFKNKDELNDIKQARVPLDIRQPN